MAYRQNASVEQSDQLSENFDVRKFIFTSRTITYSGKTVQISNVNRIWIYGYKTTYKAIYRIKPAMYLVGMVLAFIGYWLSNNTEESLFALVGLVGIAIIGYGIYERTQKKDQVTRHYGLVIETSSSREKLVSNNREFINRLFRDITIAMNHDSQKAIIANFHSGDIHYVQDNRSIQNGDIFQDIANSNITNRSKVTTY
ncbi:DUF6232 family protein [Pontibacter sp. G13]|uniref:DUF6232 family protein n=1 Tax=Pontibacter sp. G13 TaxID=3074898 RepID=UPI0028891DC7|nr:DUF6232 family protein [Pontibacter sp. G13]WNJ20464.1 DUF6232 family protein [Pontibacter sp. G13]